MKAKLGPSKSDGGSLGFYRFRQWRAILHHISAIVFVLLARLLHMPQAFQLGFVCVGLAMATDWSRSRSRTMERKEDMPTLIDNSIPKLEKIKEADRTNTDPDKVFGASMVTYVNDNTNRVQILFYQKFNRNINNWDLKKEIPDSTAGQMRWLKSIKRILKSIASTHKQNATMSEASMRNDFIQFRDFLRERLPKTWRDLNLFLDFFDKPIEFESYVKKLIRHPFLMGSQKRLKYFFRIGQAFEQNIISQHHFKRRFQDGLFSEHMGWNSTKMYNRMSQDLKATIDYGKSHRITYEGHLLDTLVMFLRNVYVHRAHSGKYEVLDKEVNRLYPGFLSKLHELLPSKEELNRPTVRMSAEGEAGQGPSMRLLQG